MHRLQTDIPKQRATLTSYIAHREIISEDFGEAKIGDLYCSVFSVVLGY